MLSALLHCALVFRKSLCFCLWKRQRQGLKRSPVLVLAISSAAAVFGTSEYALAAEAKMSSVVSVPCQQQSDLHAAKQAVDNLAAQVGRLAGQKDLELIQVQMAKLLGSKCFAMSAENARWFDTKSVAAFRRWWKDGGELWIRSYLHLGKGAGAEVILPPDVGASLDTDTSEGGPLSKGVRSLLCPSKELSCGAETRSYRRRFEIFNRKRNETDDREDSEPCVSVAKSTRYPQWRTCLEEHRPLVPSLPVGEMRAPNTGWLILRDSVNARGCDRARAYDVATGSAYIVERCGLRGGGMSVAGRNSHSQTLSTGTVSREALREALWMLLLMSQVSLRQVDVYSVSLPKGIAPAWPDSEHASTVERSWVAAVSDAVAVSWTWIEGGKSVADGALCKTGCAPGQEYASALISVFESGLNSEVHPQPLPEEIKRTLYRPE
jgi:hypothetical protein